MRKLLCALFILGLFARCNVTTSTSRTIDTSFGSSGRVSLDFNDAEDGISGVAIQSNGAIVVVGRAYSGSTSDFAIARYDTTGNLDTTFDTDGKNTTDFGGNDEARAVAIQSDGKIVVAGVTTSGSTSQIAVARYTAAGALDESFNSDGKTILLILSNSEANAIAIDGDGNILVAGFANSSRGSKQFALARFESDGDLDADFNTDGKYNFSIGSEDVARGLALQADGKILVAGGSTSASTQSNFGIARLTSAGELDTTFDGDGKATIDFVTAPSSSNDIAYGVRALSSGKIVLGGTVNDGTNDLLALAQLTSTGLLDTTFNSTGKSTLGYTDSAGETFSVQGRALALDASSEPVLVGFVSPDSSVDVAIAQFQGDGTADNGFGDSGILTNDVSGQSDEAFAVAVQSDGKKIVGGRTFNGSDYDFLLLRYQ